MSCLLFKKGENQSLREKVREYIKANKILLYTDPADTSAPDMSVSIINAFVGDEDDIVEYVLALYKVYLQNIDPEEGVDLDVELRSADKSSIDQDKFNTSFKNCVDTFFFLGESNKVVEYRRNAEIIKQDLLPIKEYFRKKKYKLSTRELNKLKEDIKFTEIVNYVLFFRTGDGFWGAVFKTPVVYDPLKDLDVSKKSPLNDTMMRMLRIFATCNRDVIFHPETHTYELVLGLDANGNPVTIEVSYSASSAYDVESGLLAPDLYLYKENRIDVIQRTLESKEYITNADLDKIAARILGIKLPELKKLIEEAIQYAATANRNNLTLDDFDKAVQTYLTKKNEDKIEFLYGNAFDAVARDSFMFIDELQQSGLKITEKALHDRIKSLIEYMKRDLNKNHEFMVFPDSGIIVIDEDGKSVDYLEYLINKTVLTILKMKLDMEDLIGDTNLRFISGAKNSDGFYDELGALGGMINIDSTGKLIPMAGLFDMIVVDSRGIPHITDFKTTANMQDSDLKSVLPKYMYQTVFYQKIIASMDYELGKRMLGTYNSNNGLFENGALHLILRSYVSHPNDASYLEKNNKDYQKGPYYIKDENGKITKIVYSSKKKDDKGLYTDEDEIRVVNAHGVKNNTVFIGFGSLQDKYYDANTISYLKDTQENKYNFAQVVIDLLKDDRFKDKGIPVTPSASDINDINHVHPNPQVMARIKKKLNERIKTVSKTSVVGSKAIEEAVYKVITPIEAKKIGNSIVSMFSDKLSEIERVLGGFNESYDSDFRQRTISGFKFGNGESINTIGQLIKVLTGTTGFSEKDRKEVIMNSRIRNVIFDMVKNDFVDHIKNAFSNDENNLYSGYGESLLDLISNSDGKTITGDQAFRFIWEQSVMRLGFNERIQISKTVSYEQPSNKFRDGGIVSNDDDRANSTTDEFDEMSETEKAEEMLVNILEGWQYDNNSKKIRDSLSITVKRELNTLESEWTDWEIQHYPALRFVKNYVDCTTITNILLPIICKASTLEGMKFLIKETQMLNENVKSALINKLNNDEKFASEFKRAFRKQQNLYGQVSIYFNERTNSFERKFEILNMENKLKVSMSNTKSILFSKLENYHNISDVNDYYTDKEILDYINSISEEDAKVVCRDNDIEFSSTARKALYDYLTNSSRTQLAESRGLHYDPTNLTYYNNNIKQFSESFRRESRPNPSEVIDFLIKKLDEINNMPIGNILANSLNGENRIGKIKSFRNEIMKPQYKEVFDRVFERLGISTDEETGFSIISKLSGDNLFHPKSSNLYRLLTAIKNLNSKFEEVTNEGSVPSGSTDRFIGENDADYTPSNALFRKGIGDSNSPFSFTTVNEIDKNKIDDHGKQLWSIYNNIYSKFSGVLNDGSIDSNCYLGDKNHYTYVNPSFINNLINKITGKDVSVDSKKYIEDNYLNSGYFASSTTKKYKMYIVDKFRQKKYVVVNENEVSDYENKGYTMESEISDVKILNTWLQELYDAAKEGYEFDMNHITQLAVKANNKVIQYRDMDPGTYLMSIIQQYYSHPNSDMAYFRVATLSNKPSSEFVSFKKYKINDDMDKKDSHVIRGIVSRTTDIFTQELWRIKNVIDRCEFVDGKRVKEPIDVYDIPVDSLPKALVDKLKLGANERSANKVKFTENDIKTLFSSKGACKFAVLKYLNSNNSSEFLKYITDFVNGEQVDFSTNISTIVTNGFTKYMNDRYANSLVNFANLGLFNVNVSIIDNHDGSSSFVIRFPSLAGIAKNLSIPIIRDSNNAFTQKTLDKLNEYNIDVSTFNALLKNTRDYNALDSLQDGINKYITCEANRNSGIASILKDFYYNDWFAQVNMIQITSTDISFFKNYVEFQKRNAQQHSPTEKFNKEATWGGVRITDGVNRSVIINDLTSAQFKSETVSAVRSIFDEELRKYESMYGKNSPVYKAYKVVADNIVKKYEGKGEFKFEITDGQSYSSPTAYRKKMIGFGEWSDRHEEAYNRIKSGDLSNIEDLNILMQPMKPFVYSRKMNSMNRNGETLGVPFQVKNSEYMIFIADALIQGSKNSAKSKVPPYLEALYEFMENSYEKMGIDKGIDTIEFASCVKVGKSGSIDLHSNDDSHHVNVDVDKNLSKDEIVDKLESLCYTTDPIGNLVYNKEFVHEIDYDDYGMQQKVPAHFTDHMQQMGSQDRVLSFADAPEYYHFFNFKTGKFDDAIESSKAIEEYEKNLADKIENDIKEIRNKFLLDASDDSFKEQLQNLLLSEITQQGDKYGSDLEEAIQLIDVINANGNGTHKEFRRPLNDPAIASRIQQLLNSIIKNKVNKTKFPGGPIVQVTCWGKTDDLHVRFRDKEGKILLSRNEFEDLKDGHADRRGYNNFDDYIVGEKYALAYLEAYAPVPTEDLMQKLKYTDIVNGKPVTRILSFDEALKKGVLTHAEVDEYSRFIGYRIPTESYYSMLPVKIVGFMPKIAGEGIMLPTDITLLTGSDFDIDKLYTINRKYWFSEKADTLGLSNFIYKTLDRYGSDIFSSKVYVDTVKEVIDYVYSLPNNPFKGMTNINAIIDRLKTKEGLDDISNITGGFVSKEQFLSQVVSKIIGRNTSTTKFLNALNNGTIAENFGIENKEVEMYFMENFKSFSKTGTISPNHRDNKIFDFQWGSLCDKETLPKMFNPQTFDPQKKVAYITCAIQEIDHSKLCSALKISKDGSGHYNEADLYEKLNSLSIDDLKDLINDLSDENDHDIHFVDSQVYFQAQNMAAAKLIGAFANSNIAHTFLARQNIRYCPKGNRYYDIRDISLGGYTIFAPNAKTGTKGSLIDKISDDPRFAGRAFDGTLISKNIAGFLAASVDAAKDPVLNFLNLNSTTVNAAMTLIRFGFPVETVSLFMSQPIIKELVKIYQSKMSTGFVSFDSVVNQLANKIRPNASKEIKFKKPSNNSSADGNITTSDSSLQSRIADVNTFTTEKLFVNLGKSIEEDPDMNVMLLYLFQHIRNISKDMSDMTVQCKFNSITNAVGPNITDTLILRNRVEKFYERYNDCNFSINEDSPYEKSEVLDVNRRIINKSPILTAYYYKVFGDDYHKDTTDLSLDGIERAVMKKCGFIHYTDLFDRVFTKFNDIALYKIDNKRLNSIINEFIYYNLTRVYDSRRDTAVPSDLSSRYDAIFNFAEYYNTFKKEIELGQHKDIAYAFTVLDYSYLYEEVDDTGKSVISLRDVSMTPEAKETLKHALNTILGSSDPAGKEFCKKLFMHNVARSGFNFRGNNIYHFMTTRIIESIPEFHDAFHNLYDSLENQGVDEMDFVFQYLMNNPLAYEFIQDVYDFNRDKLSCKVSDNGEDKITISISTESDNKSSVIHKTKLFLKSATDDAINNSKTGIGRTENTDEVYIDSAMNFVVPVVRYNGELYRIAYEENCLSASRDCSSVSVVYKKIPTLGDGGRYVEYDANVSDINEMQPLSLNLVNLGNPITEVIHSDNIDENDINMNLFEIETRAYNEGKAGLAQIIELLRYMFPAFTVLLIYDFVLQLLEENNICH